MTFFRVKNTFLRATALLLLPLAACIGTEKRATDTGPDKPNFGFTQSLQYSITSSTVNANTLREYMSTIASKVIVASTDSDISNVTNPELGCLLEAQDGIALGSIRYLDVGDMKLHGSDISAKVFDKDPTPNATSYQIPDFLLTLGNTYQIETTGVGDGVLAWNQDFLVPAGVSGVSLQQTYGGKDYSFTLPMPELYDPVRDQDRALINRFTDFTLNYAAPAGTTYVKAHFSDGGGDYRSNPYGNVNCYGSPKGPITVPGGLLGNFKNTNDGLLQLDFIAVSDRTDVPRVKESAIISVTRQLHGRVDIPTASGKATFYFGTLSFD